MVCFVFSIAVPVNNASNKAKRRVIHVMTNHFYITTPIYYVNDVPHIGNAYTTIAADILARYHRQLGDDVFFLTGTDEHGNPAARAAERRGLSPLEHVNEMVKRFQELARRVNASNDFFIRTTDPEHERSVQKFLGKLYDRGDIYLKSYRGLYCPACEAFYAPKDLLEGKCPDHGTVCDEVEEENYFFRLSAYQSKLIEHFDKHPEFVKPQSRFNEARSFITGGLEDISISRATLKWGIPIPWDESQVVYVWVDALLNYLSALEYAGDHDLTPEFWPASYHMMAKDILKFHAVIWPALLMAAGNKLPEHLFVHGYLLMGGQKMSKTRGNVLDPFDIINRYGADAFRFYCFREVTFGQDGVVSIEGLDARYNTELANDLGNLVSRTTAMIEKFGGGLVPAATGSSESDIASLAGFVTTDATAAMSRVDLTGALEKIWVLVRRLNKYIEDEAPWKLAKDKTAANRLELVLYNLAEGLRICALLLQSFMPETSAEILRRLGQATKAGGLRQGILWGGLKTGGRVIAGEPLFPKIERS